MSSDGVALAVAYFATLGETLLSALSCSWELMGVSGTDALADSTPWLDDAVGVATSRPWEAFGLVTDTED